MKLKVIKITICEACLNGEGDECHTPGCALFLHSVDLPFMRGLYEVLEEFELDGDDALLRVEAPGEHDD